MSTRHYHECANYIAQSNRHALVIGAAGSGKSYWINNILKTKNTLRLAPSGLTALNIKGATIHSFFSFQPMVQYKTQFRLSKQNIEIIIKAEFLLIDEISMVRSDLLDAVNETLCSVRNSYQPFGGLQTIFVGDPFQLGPIVKKQDFSLLRRMYFSLNPSFYFFNSNVFSDSAFLSKLDVFELSNYHRQNNLDFIKILNEIRTGTANELSLLSINRRISNNPPQNTSFVTVSRESSENINEGLLEFIDSPSYYSAPMIHRYRSEVQPDIQEELIKESFMSKKLHIKKGMYVLFIKNDSKATSRWVNGTKGIVEKVNAIDKDNIRSLLIKTDSEKIVEVFPVIDTISVPIYNPTNDSIDSIAVASIHQFPIIPAWSMTIHKSQGMTLPSVAIDLESGTQSSGQTYVALSRVKNLENIYLSRPIRISDVKVDEQIQRFYLGVKLSSYYMVK